MEEVGVLNNFHSVQRPQKPAQVHYFCWLHHTEMVICERKYDVCINGVLGAPSHPCINQIPLYLPGVPALPLSAKKCWTPSEWGGE